MRLETWIYYFRESFASLKKNLWMSFASTGVVAITLLIFGIFLLAVLNLNFMSRSLEASVEISVFLQPNATDDERVETSSYIKSLPGVASARYVSKEEGLVELQKEMGWGESDLEVVGQNPLPDAFYIKTKSPAYVAKVAKSLEKHKTVMTVRYGKDVVDKLFKFTRAIRYAGVFIIVLLAVSAVFIISNTIKLTVYGRRKEISIMKSVGATNWFIRWPFALEGMFIGIFGGVIATLILYFSYRFLVQQTAETLPFISMIKDPAFIYKNYYLIIVMGGILGLVGSAVSMRKFLKI